MLRRSDAFWRALDEVDAVADCALAHGQRAGVRGAVRRIRRSGGFGVTVEDARAASAVARSSRPDWELVERYLSGDGK